MVEEYAYYRLSVLKLFDALFWASHVGALKNYIAVCAAAPCLALTLRGTERSLEDEKREEGLGPSFFSNMTLSPGASSIWEWLLFPVSEVFPVCSLSRLLSSLLPLRDVTSTQSSLL